MPAVSREQYRALKPYVTLAERLGHFASQVASGNPAVIRFVYSGKLAEANTSLLRNAGLAGVLTRSTSNRANLINAMQIAEHRGWNIAERHESRSGYTDTIRIEIETDIGITYSEGAVVFDKPRLLQIDGIQCDATLDGFLTLMKNQDVPGVIGYVGTVLGRNRINIANFSLGRRDAPLKLDEPLEAIALVTTDEPVPESVLAQLRENPAVRFARSVEFRQE
jgi:D-3-phosphoglycerate dehydrogenase / 2-oxoglutarate reductase